MFLRLLVVTLGYLIPGYECFKTLERLSSEYLINSVVIAHPRDPQS